jgi:hypothetical protein
MKRFTFLLTLSILLFSFQSFAAAVMLQWDAPLVTPGVSGPADGYSIHYTDGIEVWIVPVGNVLSFELTTGEPLNLTPGIEYDFQIEAYNVFGKSPELSNLVTYTCEGYAPITILKDPVTMLLPVKITLTIE